MVKAMEAEEPDPQGRGRIGVHRSPKAVHRRGIRGCSAKALHPVPTRGPTGQGCREGQRITILIVRPAVGLSVVVGVCEEGGRLIEEVHSISIPSQLMKEGRMRPREEGHPGQVDHHLAILTAGLSRAIR